VGVGVLGASAYVFLAGAGRALGPEAFAPVSVAWTLVATVAVGLLAPLEQETGRLTAGRVANGEGAGAVARVSGLLALLVVGPLVVVGVLAREPLADLLLRGSVDLLFACLAAVLVLAAAHVARGVLAGYGRFGRYGVQLGVEGAVRGIGAMLLLLLGTTAASPYVWLLAVAPALGVLLTLPPRADLRPGPPQPVGEVAQHLGLLLGTAAVSGAMINSGPVLVELLGGGSGPDAAVFFAVLVVARVPLFLFAAVQAVVIPSLATARVAGAAAYRRVLLRLYGVVGLLALAGVLVFGLAGPELVRLSFGPGYDAGRDVALLLSLGAGAFMLATFSGQALVAAARHRDALVGWVVGAAVLAGVTAVVPDLQLRVAGGLLAGSLAALAVMVVSLRAVVGRGAAE
jgi:O-antigen/teichoic acid export membrane protein